MRVTIEDGVYRGEDSLCLITGKGYAILQRTDIFCWCGYAGKYCGGTKTINQDLGGEGVWSAEKS